MNKLLFFTFILFSITSLGQINYVFQDDSIILDCNQGGILHNPGGNGNSYQNSETFLFTVCPNNTTGEAIAYDFNDINFGDGDFVCVYDGPTVANNLIECHNNVMTTPIDSLVRASTSNTSGCLTFQFSSDMADVGDFEIELYCEFPCQSMNAEIASMSHPIIDTVYIDVCHGETLSLTANGLFPENNLNYNQNNNNVNFYWDVGGLKDTANTFTALLPMEGFYPISLTAEDSIGCTTVNELDLRVRYLPNPGFAPVYDSIICFGSTASFFDRVAGAVQSGSVIFGDTIRTSNVFTVTSAAQYIPDDADNNSGNGISTPATYPISVSGFIPGSVITSGTQILNICLDIEHSYAGDIDIILVAPNGAQMFMVDMNPPNGQGASYGFPIGGINPAAPGTPATYCWSPTAATPPILTGTTYPNMIPPSPGAIYQAIGNWDNFIGSPVNGVWTIQVFDDFGGDDGNIFGASFEFDQIFKPKPDSFFVTYDAIGMWDANPNITSPLIQNTVQYNANTPGADVLYYQADVENFNCTIRDSLRIWVEDFDVVASGDTTLCAGLPTDLDVSFSGISGPVTYNWTPSTDLNNPNISNPIANLTGGSIEYVVGVTSNNNCTFYDTVLVQAEASFQFEASNDTIICAGESVQFETSGGAISYIWTPNDGSINDTSVANPIVSPTSTTTYNIQADSIGCSQFRNIVVQVSNIQLTSNPILLPASCGIANGTILVFADGGVGPLQYSIDGGAFQTGVSFPNLFGGNHQITISDGVGCPLDTVLLLPGGGVPPEIDSVYFENPICFNEGIIEVFLVDTNSVVNFTNSITGAVQNNGIFNNLEGGTYTISADDGSCPVVDTTIVLSTPSAPQINLNSTDLICHSDQSGSIEIIVVGGNPPYSFSIDGLNFQDSGIFAGLNADTYYVEIQDTLGCILNDSTVISQPDSLFIVDVQVDSAICFGDNGQISILSSGGVAPIQYSIDSIPNFINSNIFDASSGDYLIQIQDSNACPGSNMVSTSIYEPLGLEISLDSTINSNCNMADGSVYVSVSGGILPYSFSWSDGINQVSVLEDLVNVATGNYMLTVTDANNCTEQFSIMIMENISVSLSVASINPISCFGANDAQVQLSVNNGLMPFTFTINGANAQTDSLFLNLTGGNHVFEVIDANNCISSQTINLIEPSEIISNATLNHVSCDQFSDGQIDVNTIGGVAPYEYALNNMGISQMSGSFSNLSAGSYTVYISDNMGCLDTIESINLVQPDTLIINSLNVQDINCFGDLDGNITISASGGTQPYSYSISGNMAQDSSYFSNLGSGTYTMEVFDANNCPVASAIDSILEPEAIVLTIDSFRHLSCFKSNDGFIGLNTNGGVLPIVFSIDGGVNYVSASMFSNLEAGSYNVIAMDANMCTSSMENIVLTEPDSLFLSSSFISVTCSNFSDGSITIDQILGGTAPYQVSFNGGASTTFNNNLTFENLQGNQSYTIEVTDSNSCTLLETIFIDIPVALQIQLENIEQVSCFGLADAEVELGVLGGTANYNFSFGGMIENSNGQPVLYNDLNAGSYLAIVEDANGCLDSVNINITQPDLLSIDSISLLQDISCFGANDAALMAFASGGYLTNATTGDYTYLWTPTGSINASINGLSSGIHTVTVTDDNNCFTSLSYTVEEVLPLLASILPDSSSIIIGDTLSLNVEVINAVGSLTYSWSPTTGLSCSDCVNPEVTVFNDIEYNVVVTDSNGCSNRNNAQAYIGVSNPLFYFIPNSFTPNGDGINDSFRVLGQNLEKVTVKIYNRWGENVFIGENQFQKWDGTYKGEMQTTGVYSYVIDLEFLDNITIQKVGSISLIR